MAIAGPSGGEEDSRPPPADDKRVFLVVADDTPEMAKALRFAARRATHVGGTLGILRIIEPADFQHWAAVGNLMRGEAREEAEKFLQECAAKVSEFCDRLPVLYLREGDTKDEVLKLIEEDPDIRVLVLGAAADGKGPGPLVSFLTRKVVGKMRIPVMLVPGGLTDEEIDALS